MTGIMAKAVETADTLVQMIEAQRAYEINSKMVSGEVIKSALTQ